MKPAARRRAARGLTLIELMVVLATMAVLLGLAVPSFGAQLARHRLKAAAETLAADLAQARFEAARRGAPLHVHFAQGTQWCWVIATASGCDCAGSQACQVRTVRSTDHPGVQIEQSQDALFDPANGAAIGDGAALLKSARGDTLRVATNRLGRVHVCAPDASTLGYPRC